MCLNALRTPRTQETTGCFAVVAVLGDAVVVQAMGGASDQV